MAKAPSEPPTHAWLHVPKDIIFGDAPIGVFAVARLLLLGLVGLVALRVVYRLYLHPLAKYPGPFWARITSLRNLYQAWQRRQHLDLHEMHEKYGPIVRYGPNLLSVNDPFALQAIYGFKANTRKSDFYLAFPAVPGAVSTHTAMDPKVHARKRRVMSAAFSDAALKNAEKYVLPHISEFLRLLSGVAVDAKGDDGGSWREAVNVTELDGRLTFDVMGDLAYGKPFGVMGEKPENRRGMFLLSQASRLHNLDGCVPFLKASGLDRLVFPNEYRHRQEFIAFSRKLVSQRIEERSRSDKASLDAQTEPRKDFFYYLQNGKDPETGNGFSANELWAESNTIIVAGSDTTATSTSCTLFYLVHNPQCLERLCAEIRGAFASLDDICQGPRLNACTYLRACIDEAMRMSPAVGILLERVVGPGGLDVLPGERVPAGTIVGAPIYALHHHRDHVRDPFTYDPTRWLHEMDDAGVADPAREAAIAALRRVFNPFSVGPRSCIGKPMAYMEMTLTLARLLWRYDVRLPRGAAATAGMGRPGLGSGRERPAEYQLYHDFVAEPTPLKIDIRPRKL